MEVVEEKLHSEVLAKIKTNPLALALFLNELIVSITAEEDEGGFFAGVIRCCCQYERCEVLKSAFIFDDPFEAYDWAKGIYDEVRSPPFSTFVDALVKTLDEKFRG